MLGEKFEEYVDSLQIEDLEEEVKRAKEITKRLNNSFWAIDSDEEHSEIVGSVGRETAINTFSDIDMLFILPKDLKNKYDKYSGNGQSKLLQDVKKEIKRRYSKTIVRGDGQVVVVSFESINKTIEVCPAFERADGAYDYPDSNNGGSWKKTDPMPEITESLETITQTNYHFKYMCNLIRAWKNNVGFKFGGLLIDTLVYKFIEENEQYKNTTFNEYLTMLQDIFKYLKNQNKDQKFWYALGSNQKVYNKDGKFVAKAKNVYEKLENLTEESEDLYDVLQDIFGKKFPILEAMVEKAISHKSVFYEQSVKQTEEFIENKFLLDIRYRLRIDCHVKQNGFRDMLLRTILRKEYPLKTNKKLEFFIVENEFAGLFKDDDDRLPYEVYWKVLNRGEEAIRRDCIRGQIVQDNGKQKKNEPTQFKGKHYVECYIVYRNICVARDKISVPISNGKVGVN